MKWAISTLLMLSLLAAALPVTFAQGGPRAARVVTAEVFEKEISPTSRIVGVVDFDRRAGISPEVSGLIESQSIVEGATIKKGDVLVKLNTEFIQKDIDIRRKEAEAIGVKIANTRKNLNRYKALLKSQAASEKATEDLADALRELVKQREMVRQGIEKLKLQLEKSTIKAPFDGLVLGQYKYVGEWISPGTPVAALGAIDSVYVNAAISEDLVRYFEPGKEITVFINAIDREFTGTVAGFVPVADPATKTFQMKIDIPYFEEVIQNMSATVNVPTGNVRKLMMIKRDALIRNEGKVFVYTVKEGKASILPVNIVSYEGEFVGVDNPHFQPGMPVVIEGNDRLRPDQPVEVIETKDLKAAYNQTHKG